MGLTDVKVRRAKPKDRRYRLSDRDGLYLHVFPSGKKVWKFRYRKDGKDTEFTVGEYPIITLAAARARAQEIRQMLIDGVPPDEIKNRNRVEDMPPQESKERTILFKDVADDFLRLKEHEYSASHFFRQQKRIEQYILPFIGDRSVDEISKKDIINIVKSVPNVKTRTAKPGNKIETARRIFTLLKQIYTYGVHNDFFKENIPAKIDINVILPKADGGRLKAITDEGEIKRIYKLLDSYDGEVTRLALKFLALTALRPGNIRNLKWEYVDEKNGVIIFPAAAMKSKKEYRLPLTERLMGILEDIAKFTQSSEYVFCSPIATSKQMSENTLNYAHKRIGLENHNAHGWRSAFSTICYEKQKEHGFSYEVIESQLAHSIGSKVTRAYMRSDFLDERRELLKWWENFLSP